MGENGLHKGCLIWLSAILARSRTFFPLGKIDLEKEDVYSEAPVEGGPKVAELLEDLVDSVMIPGKYISKL